MLQKYVVANAFLRYAAALDFDFVGRTEDDALRQAVTRWTLSNGLPSWTDIGREVDGRTPMQCRERWCNRLDPALKAPNHGFATLAPSPRPPSSRRPPRRRRPSRRRRRPRG